MTTEFTEYITVAGDRWDLIAFKAYGRAGQFLNLIAANPGVVATPFLDAGLRIVVPIIETVTGGTTAATVLPPWKK